MCDRVSPPFFFFFFNDTATTEIYTLSLHDALPICARKNDRLGAGCACAPLDPLHGQLPLEPRYLAAGRDRKSTRLNSSHVRISYAVFCLKKKKTQKRMVKKIGIQPPANLLVTSSPI